MNDLFQVLPEFHNHAAFPILLIIGILLLLAIINRQRIHEAWLKFRTRRCLNQLGLEQLSNIECPDGLDNHFTIDRLVLRHNGISLLVHKQYPGKIFCSDNIDQWTQMLGQKSFKFDNPLFELDYQVKALELCFPGVEIDGYLFFDHDAEFPKGHPDRVIYPAAIPAVLKRNHRHKVNSDLLNLWREFQAKAIPR